MKPLITIFFLFTSTTAFPQAPKIQWEKSIPGVPKLLTMHVTSDHGFILAGSAGNFSHSPAAVAKLDSLGNLEWEGKYGGSTTDYVNCIRETADRGYIFACSSYSDDGDVTGHHGSISYTDVWVVKLDSEGKMEWENSYGGSFHDFPSDILQTYDGGYIVAATTFSSDGDVTGLHGNQENYDYWLLKLNHSGSIQWEKCYGGTYDEQTCSILQTPDSGYFIAGYSTSNDGDVTGYHGRVYNVPNNWIIKIDESGQIQGETCLPGSEGLPRSICFSNQGGYMIAGISGSFPKHSINEHGDGDMCVIQLTKRGRVDTVCVMGGSGNDVAFSINQTTDRGYILAGQTLAGDGDVTGFHGFFDEWVVKLDSNLKLQWEEALGGSGADVAYSVEQTPDGGYIVGGVSDSYDGQVTGDHYGNWIVKLAPDHPAAVVASSAPSNDSNKNLLIYPNPSNNEVNVSFPFSNNIITISDLFGRELRQWKMESGKLKMVDVNFLHQGVYVVEIKDEKGNLIAEEKLFK